MWKTPMNYSTKMPMLFFFAAIAAAAFYLSITHYIWNGLVLNNAKPVVMNYSPAVICDEHYGFL